MIRVIGYIEAAIAAGLAFGPLMASVVYAIGGYTAPFWTFAVLNVGLVVLVRSKIEEAI